MQIALSIFSTLILLQNYIYVTFADEYIVIFSVILLTQMLIPFLAAMSFEVVLDQTQI